MSVPTARKVIKTMADLKVSHAPPPPPVRPVAKVTTKPPEAKVQPAKTEPPKSEPSHGPAVVLAGAFAKPPAKPAAGLQAANDRPSAFASPKSGGDRPGQHVNHVI